jgi:hypothetical protein
VLRTPAFISSMLRSGVQRDAGKLQSSASRDLTARYLLASTACCRTVIYYFAVTKSPALSRRRCLITPVKPQLQPTFRRHHKGVA